MRLIRRSFQAIIEGATGVKWSKEIGEHDPIDLEGIDPTIFENPDVLAESREFAEGDDLEEDDFRVDQQILDDLKMPAVPYTQDVSASQVPAGQTTGQESAAADAAELELARKRAAAALQVRENQALMASGLKKVRRPFVYRR